MPVKPDSRYAGQPILSARAPDGGERQVVALRLRTPRTEPQLRRHRVNQAEPLDLLARRLYGAEGLWWRILDANPIVYPLDLAAGDLLVLPGVAAATRATRARQF
jgi:phage tail protein X